MADFGTPVAPQVNPVNGLDMMSKLLNLKQAQQNLQIGQQTLGQQTAITGQEQQKQSELAQAGQLLQSVQKGAYRDQDGNLDHVKLANDLAAIGPFAGQASSQMISLGNEIANNQKTLQGLTVARKGEMASTFSGLASNPNLTVGDVLNGVESLRQSHPGDKEYSRLLTSMTGAMPGAASSQQLQQLTAKWAAHAGSGSQAVASTVDTGKAIQPGATNALMGGFTPVGKPIPKELAPTEQPGYRARVAAATGGGAEDIGRYNEVSSAGTTAQRRMGLADQVMKLADEVRTGTLTKDFADKLTALQQSNPSITARQMLSKYAAQLKTAGASSAHTDTERGQIEAGMPNPDNMDPGAIRDSALYIRGMASLDQGRQQVADRYMREHGNDATGLRAVDDRFMQSADPLLFAYRDLPKGQVRTQFMLTHFKTPDDMKAFKDRLSHVEHDLGQ